MTLLVNRIQRFSIHDGPGIRTTVFLQGCPLACWWCHNPELRALAGDRAARWAVGPLTDALCRDARYWRASGGGVTFSGGEPLGQADALLEALGALRARGHHAAVETSGMAPLGDVQRIGRETDLWLWDLKAVDPERFARGTGGRVHGALANLAWVLEASPTPLRVRVPLISGFNADAEELERIAAWLAVRKRRPPVEVLPGHDVGRRGAERRAAPSPEEIAMARRVFDQHGLSLLPGGPTP